MANDYYHWYKAHHICTACFKQAAAPGKTKCFDCLDEDSAKSRLKRAAWNDEQRAAVNAKISASNKARYERRKADGMCVQCGRRLPQGTSVRCGICKGKARRVQEERRRKRGQRTYMECLELDNCYNCGGVPLPGKRLCAECCDKAMRNLQKANEKIQWYSHPWRKNQ